MCPFVFAVQIVTAKNILFLEVNQTGSEGCCSCLSRLELCHWYNRAEISCWDLNVNDQRYARGEAVWLFFVLVGSIAKTGKSKTMQKSLPQGWDFLRKKMVLTLHLLHFPALAVMCHDWFWCRCKSRQRNASNTFFKKPGLLGFHSDTVRCQVSADHAQQIYSLCICLCQTMNTSNNTKLYLDSYFSFSHTYSDLCLIYCFYLESCICK